MQIYWIENGRRRGPATAPDIISLVRLGDLPADTLGWHAGCSGWLPLRELPALRDFLTPQEAEEPAVETPPGLPPIPPAPAAPAAAPTAEQQQRRATLNTLLNPSASSRFLARAVDMGIYAITTLSILRCLDLPYSPFYLPSAPLFWLPYPAIEALLFTIIGTTPGKHWLGIRLASLRKRPGLGTMLLRSYLVYVIGLGCMLPPFNLITLLLCYRRHSRRNFMPWDIAAATLPIMQQRSTVTTRLIVAFFLYFCLTLSGNLIRPWLPDIERDMQQQSPRAAEIIRRWTTP